VYVEWGKDNSHSVPGNHAKGGRGFLWRTGVLITIDEKNGVVIITGDDGSVTRLAMDTSEAFTAVSQAWLRCGWSCQYVYSFTWLGRPIIQLPEDMFRVQEVIYRIKPDVIIETGIAHGGSLVFYASLCKAMDRGRVIGIDIAIRPHNRSAIEAHQLFPYVTLVEGSSTDTTIVRQVGSQIRQDETVFVVLDSNHTKQHVLDELQAYAPLVTLGSYIVAADGIMEQVVGAPRSNPDWAWNNPKAAVREFVQRDSRFVIEEPPFPFNESMVKDRVTYWPSAYLKRVR
jgi:cephalosporin hydroxylase